MPVFPDYLPIPPGCVVYGKTSVCNKIVCVILCRSISLQSCLNITSLAKTSIIREVWSFLNWKPKPTLAVVFSIFNSNHMIRFKKASIFSSTPRCALVVILFIFLAVQPAASYVIVFPNQTTDPVIGPDSTDKLKAGNIPLNPEDISPLLIGETIPTVKLMDLAGKSVSLNEAVSKSQSILIFYRGGWCPYCSKQLSGLQLIEKDLEQMGYQVIAVSTDSPKNLTATMDKQKLSYHLLSDADLNASKQFGIAFKAPASYDKILPQASDFKNTEKLLPVPSVFILDKKGKILFEYINPNITERISPELLKAAASSFSRM